MVRVLAGVVWLVMCGGFVLPLLKVPEDSTGACDLFMVVLSVVGLVLVSAFLGCVVVLGRVPRWLVK